MERGLKKTNVIIELLEVEPLIISLKRKLFVHAKIIAVGSIVDCVEPGDEVLCHNEGRELRRGIRIVDELALVLKYSNHAIQPDIEKGDGRNQSHR